ncbi:hypothetical protein SFR_0397 [Streptomyces sp. FR-008]|nr:hypothetical protein SFR_0397 [Streptomyces sp. FR-008]
MVLRASLPLLRAGAALGRPGRGRTGLGGRGLARLRRGHTDLALPEMSCRHRRFRHVP